MAVQDWLETVVRDCVCVEQSFALQSLGSDDNFVYYSDCSGRREDLLQAQQNCHKSLLWKKWAA